MVIERKFGDGGIFSIIRTLTLDQSSIRLLEY